MTSRPITGRSALIPTAILLAALLAVPAAALDLNGFLPQEGHGALALSYTSESYDHFWAGRTKVFNPGVGEVSTDTVSAWFTWGLSPDLAVVANAAYVDVDTDGLAGFEDSGFQDLAVLLEYRFASIAAGHARHDFLVAGGLRTPLSDYVANAPVSLGDGSTDALFRLVYHLEVGSFYFAQQVGFDRRGEDVPNGVPLFTEAGWTQGRLTFSGFYSRYLANGGTDIGDPGFTFPSNQEEFERIGAKVYGRVTDTVGLSLQGFTTLDGRNSGDSSGVSVGINFGF